jgi:transposase-like protein
MSLPTDEAAADLSPQDVEFIVSNHEFEPRKLRRDQFGQIDKRERVAYGHHFRWLNIEQGKTYRTIAREFDCSHVTVMNLINQARAVSNAEAGARADGVELAMMEALRERWTAASLDPDPDIAGPATVHLLKIADMRAKLTGAYAPVQVDATVVEVTAAERELQELIAQQERDNAVAATTEATEAAVTAWPAASSS